MTDLAESRGFPQREFGDIYHNPSRPEDAMTFQDFKAYPDEGDAWPDAAQAAKEWNKIRHYISQVGQVKELNKPNAGLLAVMVVHMLDPKTNQHWFFAKWTKDKTNLGGKFTSIPAGAIGDEHPGLVYKRGASEQYKIKPNDIIPGGVMSAADVGKRIANIPATAAPADLIQQLQQAVQHVASRKPWPVSIPNGAQYMAFHSKYTNEWLAPLALANGMIPNPDRKSLESNLTGGKSLVNSKVSYSETATETLTDSSITTKDGFTIGISSKAAGGGAAASLKGIADILEKKKDQFGTGFFQQPKVRRFKKVIDTIMNNGQIDGMLGVALLFGIITEDDWEGIKTGNANQISSQTKGLMKKFNARQDNPNYSPKFHLIAAIAQEVCNRLNKEDYTDVFKAIINKASMVQMYLQTKIRNKTDLDLLGFTVVWPPVVEGKIVFTAQKNFTSSEVRGKLGFKIV